jgi:thiamine kinase-like enzyme
MKCQPYDMDIKDFDRIIEDNFNLELETIQFNPVGEDSFCYTALDKDGQAYFIRLERASDHDKIEKSLRAVHKLYNECDYGYAVPPIKDKHGNMSVKYLDKYSIAVFPLKNTESLYGSEITDEDWDSIGGMIASLHQKKDCVKEFSLPLEEYDPPYKKELELVSDIIDGKSRLKDYNNYQLELMKLLREEKKDIIDVRKKLTGLKERISKLSFIQLRLTHGDPNLANILTDGEGSFYIVDWYDIGLSSVERDLSSFSGEYFEKFLHSYFKHFDQTFKLHSELFEFYLYRWIIQEISVYSYGIMYRPSAEEEYQHFLDEIRKYLPVDYDKINDDLNRINRAMEKID